LRYVLDCSVAIKWFVPEPSSDAALRLLEQAARGEATFVAPESMLAEFGYALRKIALSGEITNERAEAIIEDFLNTPIETAPLRLLLPRAMRLTIAHMAGLYDAIYLALAEREDLLVVTADDRMANAFASLNRTLRLADLPTA
jgi:predicted nucleic acid-binding protein